MLIRLDRYTTSRAQDLRRSGDIGTYRRNLRRIFSRFWKCYIGRRGYREGPYGFLIALCAALYPILSYLKATVRVGLMATVVMADDGVSFDGLTAAEGPLGGAETAFTALAEALARRGHKVEVRNRCRAALCHNGVRWEPLSCGVPAGLRSLHRQSRAPGDRAGAPPEAPVVLAP